MSDPCATVVSMQSTQARRRKRERSDSRDRRWLTCSRTIGALSSGARSRSAGRRCARWSIVRECIDRNSSSEHDECMADADTDLRAAALSHVAALENRFGVLAWDQIAAGFEFRGELVLLANRPRGIFKPQQLSRGALSIKTAKPRTGRERRYDDQIGSNAPYFVYRWQGEDANATDNRNLKDCLADKLPIIYFYAVDEALYQPIICMVAAEDRIAKA